MYYDLQKLSMLDKQILFAVLTNDREHISSYIDIFDPDWKKRILASVSKEYTIEEILCQMGGSIPRQVVERASKGLRRLYEHLDRLGIKVEFRLRVREVPADDTTSYQSRDYTATIYIERTFVLPKEITDEQRQILVMELKKIL